MSELDPDLPPDPDRDDVPLALLAQESKAVTFTADDGTTETATLVIVPALFAHSRRLREGFYNQPGGHDDE